MCHSSEAISASSGAASVVYSDRATMKNYPVTVADLGQFDQPLLVCGGAYGNLEAL